MNIVHRHCERSEAIQHIDFSLDCFGHRPRNDVIVQILNN